MDDIVLHPGEIQWGGVKVPLLRFSEEALGPDVNDKRNPCYKYVFIPKEIYVSCLVFFDVEEVAVDLPRDEAFGREKDGENMDVMIEGVLKVVDGGQKLYILFG